MWKKRVFYNIKAGWTIHSYPIYCEHHIARTQKVKLSSTNEIERLTYVYTYLHIDESKVIPPSFHAERVKQKTFNNWTGRIIMRCCSVLEYRSWEREMLHERSPCLQQDWSCERQEKERTQKEGINDVDRYRMTFDFLISSCKNQVNDADKMWKIVEKMWNVHTTKWITTLYSKIFSGCLQTEISTPMITYLPWVQYLRKTQHRTSQVGEVGRDAFLPVLLIAFYMELWEVE